jgi:hypothetical protein
MITLNEKQALRLLGLYTTGSYDIKHLYGSHWASYRVHILRSLGLQGVTKHKASFTVLRHRFNQLAGLPVRNDFDTERQFIAWAKKQARRQIDLPAALVKPGSYPGIVRMKLGPL